MFLIYYILNKVLRNMLSYIELSIIEYDSINQMWRNKLTIAQSNSTPSFRTRMFDTRHLTHLD
jgi:hypothetical protein